MKRFLLAGAALLTLTAAQPVLAADAPVYRKAPPPPAALFSWSGFYVGGTVGAIWGDSQYTNLDAAFTSDRYKISSTVIGGVTAGVNWQTGALVLGVEADYSWTNATGQTNVGCTPPACVETWPWLGTIRGRAGWAVDRVLFYVTGGAAFSRPVFSQTGNFNVATDARGWVFGGGIEYAIWDRWSIKAEYLYVNLGRPEIPIVPIIVTNTLQYDPHLNVVRIGLNYRF